MNLFDYKLISAFILLLIVNPFISLLFSTINLFYNRRIYSIFLFSFSLAIFSSVYIPHISADLSRWFTIYNNIELSGINVLYDYLKTKPDYLIYIYIYICTLLNFSKEILPFSIILITYSIYLKIFIELERLKKYSHFIFFLLIFIFAIDHRVILLGVRQGLAITLCIYGLYLSLNNQKFLSYIVYIISCLIHFMIIPITIIFIISEKIKTQKNNLIPYISLAILLLPIDNLLIKYTENLIPLLSSGNGAIVETYTIGYWGQEYTDDLSFKGRIQTIITIIPLYLSFLYLILIKGANKYRNALILSLLIVSLLSFSETLLLRYLVIPTMLLPIVILYEFGVVYTQKRVLLLVTFFVYLILFLAMLYSSRESLYTTLINYIPMNIFNIINFNVRPYI